MSRGLAGMAPELLAKLDEFRHATLEDAAEQAVSDLINGIEAKAVQLAPVDTGNLEASTVVEVLTNGKRIIGRLAFTAPYAAEVHELPKDARGPKTRAKPGNELGLAGPKYVERVLRAFQARATKDIGEALARVWRRL